MTDLGKLQILRKGARQLVKGLHSWVGCFLTELGPYSDYEAVKLRSRMLSMVWPHGILLRAGVLRLV